MNSGSYLKLIIINNKIEIIDHNTLIYKLNQYGIRRLALMLKGRKRYTF